MRGGRVQPSTQTAHAQSLIDMVTMHQALFLTVFRNIEQRENFKYLAEAECKCALIIRRIVLSTVLSIFRHCRKLLALQYKQLDLQVGIYVEA